MVRFGRKLPIGIQTFERIRREGYLYVDKTKLVWDLVSTGDPKFLSRPRRFGKSLLISTFEAYFEGRKELFEGLAIEKLEEKWDKHPVLHLDLNAERYDSPERLDAALSYYLTQWEKLYGKGENETTLSNRFKGVIRRAYEQTGKSVVVLVDEYDSPLLDTNSSPELQKELRNIVRDLEGIEVSFETPSYSIMDPVPTLYLHGYLTVKGYDPMFGLYKLGFPNDDGSSLI